MKKATLLLQIKENEQKNDKQEDDNWLLSIKLVLPVSMGSDFT